MYFYLGRKLLKSRGKTVSLAGDSRCDSPGNNAKYCTYSVMDIDTITIIHAKTLDKQEASLHSPNIEKEAISRAIKYLHDNRVTIRKLVTDTSSAVRKMIGKYIRCVMHKCIRMY